MNCQRCNSKRILLYSAKASDLQSLVLGDKEHQGYMPEGSPIGDGDYVEFDLCLDCGQVQGDFPSDFELKDDEDE